MLNELGLLFLFILSMFVIQAQIYKRLADEIATKGLQLNENDKKKENFMQQVCCISHIVEFLFIIYIFALNFNICIINIAQRTKTFYSILKIFTPYCAYLL